MIYLVSLYYPPVSDPCANRMDHLAATLVERYGPDQVCVVTGRPNYPYGKLAREFRWKLFRRRTGAHGERVHHVYEIPAPFSGRFRKTLGLLSFAVSAAVYFLLRRLRPEDVVFMTSGPVFHVYSLHLLSRLKRFRYVVDVRDLWPQVVAGMGFMSSSSWVYRSMMRRSDAAYRDAVIRVGNVDGIRDYLASVAPEGADTRLIYNPVDTTLFSPPSDDAVAEFRSQHPQYFGHKGRTVFVFAGRFSVAIDLHTLMSALCKVRKQTDAFTFVMIGYGDTREALEQFVADHELGDHVFFLDHLPRSELVHYVCAADVCYSSTKKEEINRMVVPTKMTEYMACNKFTVAVHDCPFADRAADNGSAIVSPPGDPEALAKVLLQVIRDGVGDRQVTARAYVEEHHSLNEFKKRMLSLFDDVTSSK